MNLAVSGKVSRLTVNAVSSFDNRFVIRTKANHPMNIPPFT